MVKQRTKKLLRRLGCAFASARPDSEFVQGVLAQLLRYALTAFFLEVGWFRFVGRAERFAVGDYQRKS